MAQILDGEVLEPDNHFVIYLATIVVSEFGDVLEQTSKFALGVSEDRLKHSKQEIQKAIEILLGFFQHEHSWSQFRQTYPELSDIMFTNKYYGALRCGYLELAKFINSEDALICEKAMNLISNSELSADDIKNLKELGLDKAIDINNKIATESKLRLEELQEKFGIQDIHPNLQ